MAPSAVETMTIPVEDRAAAKLKQFGNYKEIASYNVDPKAELEGDRRAKYPNYLPTWDPAQSYPPLTPFEHYEHGKDADPSFPDLLPKGVAEVSELTPTIGTEVKGVQLSQLTDAGKDQLALFVAQRKVVAFRGQDLADLPIDKALEWGGYFGRHVCSSLRSSFGVRRLTSR
jgi:sulfonate dioxygenase